MAVVYLSLGSNLGNRKEMLSKAIKEIISNGNILIASSSLYETEPIQIDGFHEAFYNQVIKIETHKSPLQLLEIIHQIELKQGRIRDGKISSRTIDVDILFYDNKIINSEELKIPHPRLHTRNFVLIPLMEIDAYFVHPKFNKTIEELYDECKDTSEIIILDHD